MANPPVNRRPGVDADIIQGTWVRGYDVPAGDQTQPPPAPCDLIISNGKSQIDQSLSNLIFANRTDAINQPVFVMALGDDPTAPIGSVNFHVGPDADPNGLISGVGPGALYTSYGTPSLWQLQTDDTTWVQISDELGGENLSETLAIGDFTGGQNIRITNGDFILGVDSSTGAGADVNIQGGGATGVAGDGGDVLIHGGSSASGVTGSLQFTTLPSGGTTGTGAANLQTGESRSGGPSGAILIKTGDTGDNGLGGTTGSVLVQGGRSFAAAGGAPFGGGPVRMWAGQATAEGQGGPIVILAGDSSNSTQTLPSGSAIAGQGGDIRIIGGNSSSTRPGGAVTLTAGDGGSGGAVGGNVELNPGSGGGGFDEGQVIAGGVFRADNIKRGSGDPNGSVNGNEGDIYQRTDLGVGQIWLNTAGTNTSWVQLAAVGDFIESFEQLNWGYFSRSGKDLGGAVEDAWSDVGIFKGIRSNSTAGDDPTFGGGLFNGPYVEFQPPTTPDVSAVDMSTGSGGLPHQREQQWILTFRARNTVSSTNGRIFLGVSSTDAQTQLASALPPGVEYLGFLLDGGVGSTWRIVTSDSLGTTGPIDTGVLDTTVSTGADGWHFIIDTTDASSVRFFILDEDLQVQFSTSISTNIPAPSTPLGPVMGCRRIVNGAPQPTLQVVHASIVNNAGVSGQGGGTVSGLTLSQVLINGNTTGSTIISVNQGSNLIGVLDDNAGDGASYGVFGGGTTGASNDTGSLTLASGNAVSGGAESPGASTGSVLVSTGFQFEATSEGNTGIIDLQTGDHAGTDGVTGDVILRTGAFTNGAAGTRTQGDIRIAPGSFIPNTASTTGDVVIKGGSSNLTGVTGGDISISSGENSSAVGDTGGVLIETFPVNLDGDSGGMLLSTGSAGTVAGDSGGIGIVSGTAAAGESGFVALVTGDAGNGQAGAIDVVCGNTSSGDGSNITIQASTTTDVTAAGGDIILNPGSGGAGNGQVLVNGKLTVTGLIDPTGLVLEGQTSVPVTVGSGEGLIYVDDTVSPSRLFYVDDTNTSHDISTGGGASALGDLTDVTLTGPVAGEVLTYNGADWVNLPGVGGSPLATILGIGNTTGALPIVVEDTLGSSITSDGNLELTPAATPGAKVILDGIEWPEADGPAGYVLTTNGLGTLSFQPGGGGGSSFAEAFAQMQWGSLQASGSLLFQADGIFQDAYSASTGGSTNGPTLGSPDGLRLPMVTGGAAGAQVVTQATTRGVRLDSRYLAIFKFDGAVPATDVRHFVGLTTSTLTPPSSTQVASTTPATPHIGVQLYSDVPQTTLNFIVSQGGAPTRFNTGVAPATAQGYYLVVDATVSGQVTLSLYDEDFTVVPGAVHTFVSGVDAVPIATMTLYPYNGAEAIAGVAPATFAMYSMTAVNRADLLSTLGGGGGGSQDLASVLGIGNETNSIPIQGSDNVAGTGSDLELLGGSSTGGGGAGGNAVLIAGDPDPGGNGDGGGAVVSTGDGAGTGDAGNFDVVTGDGGASGGNGGSFQMALGSGAGTGDGGDFQMVTGFGGAGGGDPGNFEVVLGSALGGAAVDGGEYNLLAGGGFGTGDGGGFNLFTGAGGAGGGDGGDFEVTLGAGAGGGVDGVFRVIGDAEVTGKLTVTGMIDPPGLLMSSSVSTPFTPAGTEGGLWVNSSAELIYTNLGGSLNLSTAFGGGVTWLDALLTAGYGMLNAGSPGFGPQSDGVYGGSSVTAVSPGPPPASATFGEDGDGPFTNIAVGANPLSEAFIATADVLIQRSSQFKARFKFQITSPAHTDERIFIGFTDDTSITTPSPQLAADDPVGQQYMGIRQDLTGFNLEFVARGSGGAITPVFAIPTDALVHYLEIDASSGSGSVTFTIYDSDGTTISGGGTATHTEPASLQLPDLATATRPFIGIHSATGTTPRGVDFYFSTIVTRADVVNAVSTGGGGGASDLETVLIVGNTTGGTDIEITDGDSIVGQTLATGDGGAVNIIGGEETTGGSSADGGVVALVPGVSTGVGGNVGSLFFGSVLAGTPPDGSAGAGTTDGGDSMLFAAVIGNGGDNLTGDAGHAGDFIFAGGNGGVSTDGVSPNRGGNSSSILVTLGTGGDGTHSGGTGRGGDGGNFFMSSSNGGIGLGTTGGTGGDAGSFLMSFGSGGDGLSAVSGTATGGSSASFQVVSGGAGDAVGADGGTGGTGEDFVFNIGGGGNGTSTASGTATGGVGGTFTTLTGGGGTAAGFAGAIGGNSGDIQLAIGAAGAATATSTGTAVSGDGGAFQLGTGNSAVATGRTGATGGDGGNFELATGFGGDAGVAVAGAAAAGAGGGFLCALGDGGDGVSAVSGTGTGGDGGGLAATAGDGGLGRGEDGGTGGEGGGFEFTLGNGGDATVDLTGSGAANAGDGGAFTIISGTGGTVAGLLGTPSLCGRGGDIALICGPGGTTGFNDGEGGTGGGIVMTGGDGGGGHGTETGGDGGPVVVIAGDGGAATAGDGAPGDVVISGGAAVATGAGPGPSGGLITLGTPSRDSALDDDAGGIKFGTIAKGAGGGTVTVTYTTALPAGHMARSIQLTIEAAAGDFPGGTGAMTAFVVEGTNSNTGFDIDLMPDPDGAITIHWVAFP